MNRLFLMILPMVLFACGGENKSVDEKVELKTAKDKLSYVLGAMNAKTIVGTNDPNIAKLDLNEVAEGFNENFNENKPSDCEQTLVKLFGPNFQDFNPKHAKDGARCLGRLTAYAFYQDMKKMDGLSKVDIEMAKIGFKQGLFKKDSIVNDQEKNKIISSFIAELTRSAGDKMIQNAKKIQGAQVFENNIVIQTLSEGNGASPSEKDDVKIEYILLNAMGDTMQSSYKMKQMTGSKDAVALKLNGGVIPGWTYALPKMKKGGKYKLYVPWNLAYGEQGMYNPQAQRMDIQPFESLVFVIDLIDFAKEGTFVKPQTSMPTN